MIEKIDSSCAICESNDTHKCGSDYLCDDCCSKIMSIPDELSELFEWLDKIVLPQTIKLKQLRKEVQEVISNIPDNCQVIIREGNGEENLAASLAVSVAKLSINKN